MELDSLRVSINQIVVYPFLKSVTLTYVWVKRCEIGSIFMKLPEHKYSIYSKIRCTGTYNFVIYMYT